MPIADARLMVEQMAKSEAWKKLDDIDRDLEENPEAFFSLPTDHLFPPGQYVRTVFMAAGRWVSTRIHLADHPFFISAGRILVWTAETGTIELSAPHIGITKVGTRRMIYVLEDCIFSTCHPNPENETDPDKLMERYTYNNRELREKVP